MGLIDSFERRCSALLALSLAAAGGCHHAAPVREEPRSSFRFVTPPKPPPVADDKPAVAARAPTETFAPPAPIAPLATPTYPTIERAKRPPLATVGLRITIDARGRVSETGPSLHAFSTPGPFAGAFQEAVERAVAQWRFRPAVIHHLETVAAPDGGSFLRLKDTEAIDWTFDVAFTFTANGDVLSGASDK